MPDLARLKIASFFNESARASSGTGAARTTTCVKKETASMRDLMINIWKGLCERGVGWRPAWESYCSWCDFIPEAGAIYIPSRFTYLLFHHPSEYLLPILELRLIATSKHFSSWPLDTDKPLLPHGDRRDYPCQALPKMHKQNAIVSGKVNKTIWCRNLVSKKLSLRTKMKGTWSLWMGKKTKITQPQVAPDERSLENRMRKCSDKPWASLMRRLSGSYCSVMIPRMYLERKETNPIATGWSY